MADAADAVVLRRRTADRPTWKAMAARARGSVVKGRASSVERRDNEIEVEFAALGGGAVMQGILGVALYLVPDGGDEWGPSRRKCGR